MRAVAVFVTCLLLPLSAAAQHVEIAPFGGYRFGGDFLEYLSGTAQDTDGGPAFGAAVDVPLQNGLAVEFLYSRQTAHADLLTAPGRISRIAASNDHWQVGGFQDLALTPRSIVRPFLTGTLGLTRMSLGGNSEVRFSLGAGGGVKLQANEHVALRLDGRVYVTFADVDASAAICSSGGCITGLHVSTLWQMDFTAGVAFRL